jgi:hypothetical protein
MPLPSGSGSLDGRSGSNNWDEWLILKAVFKKGKMIQYLCILDENATNEGKNKNESNTIPNSF